MFDRIRAAWLLFKTGYKIHRMTIHEREIYITELRNNIDLSEDLTMDQKKRYYQFLDRLERELGINI